MGVMLGLKISDFGWKWGVFSSKIHEKGVFSKLEYEPGICYGRELGGPGACDFPADT